jgi:2-polyprenyl-3-methyl-5-hydroxy-6-metoxy-1,4-benzoquinol methylase
MQAVFNQSYIGLRPDLIKHVSGRGRRILDIGCATGATGKYLLDNGTAEYVEGVEIDTDMALVARQQLPGLVEGNIEDPAIFDQISQSPFDYILIGDVLEHLYDPWALLSKLRKERLSPSGKIIFSVPNIGHIDVFIHLFIKRYWPYNNRGIFDKTHLRWFTRRNVVELAQHAGLQIDRLDRNYRFRDRIDSRFPPYGFVLKRLFSDLYTFQYIAVCSISPGKAQVSNY